MTPAEYQQAIQTERLPLTISEKFNHFGIVIYSLTPAIALPLFNLYGWINNEFQEFSIKEVQIVSISIIASIFFYWLQKERLKLTVIPANLYKKDLRQITIHVLKELKWHGRFKGDVCVVHTDRSFFSGSWGEQVTIIVDEDRILINSVCDLQKRTSLASWGNNARNVGDFTAKFHEYASQQIKAESSVMKIEN